MSSSSHIDNNKKKNNGANSNLFVNGTEIIKFKANDSEISVYPLCLGNIQKTGQ